MNSPSNKFKTYFLNFILFFVGCYGTSKIAQILEVSVIASGCAITLLCSSVPMLRLRKLDALVYCACFAGMCSTSILNNPLDYVLVSALGAFFYQILEKKFIGVGGKLGTVAFLSVAAFVLARGLR